MKPCGFRNKVKLENAIRKELTKHGQPGPDFPRFHAAVPVSESVAASAGTGQLVRPQPRRQPRQMVSFRHGPSHQRSAERTKGPLDTAPTGHHRRRRPERNHRPRARRPMGCRRLRGDRSRRHDAPDPARVPVLVPCKTKCASSGEKGPEGAHCFAVQLLAFAACGCRSSCSEFLKYTFQAEGTLGAEPRAPVRSRLTTVSAQFAARSPCRRTPGSVCRYWASMTRKYFEFSRGSAMLTRNSSSTWARWERGIVDPSKCCTSRQ